MSEQKLWGKASVKEGVSSLEEVGRDKIDRQIIESWTDRWKQGDRSHRHHIDCPLENRGLSTVVSMVLWYSFSGCCKVVTLLSG